MPQGLFNPFFQNGASWYGSGGGEAPIVPIDFTGINRVIEMGDSIMVSNNASPASNSYRARLASTYTWTEVNLSLGGSGTWNEISSFHQATVAPRATTVIIESAGLNDIRNSHDQKTFNKIESCLHSILKRCFQKSGVAAGSGSVTRSGSFTVFDAAVHGGKYDSAGGIGGNSACFNTTANATWTYAFTGVAISVTFSASDPTINRGVAEIRIDGVLVDTVDDLMQRFDGVSDGVNDNKRGPHTVTYFGLTNAAHSIEVKALTGSPSVVVDEFSVLDENIANLGVVFVLEVPKITDYAIAGRDQASDAYIDQVNALRESVVDLYAAAGYPVYFIPIMLGNQGFYDVTTGIDSDGVHPTNTGHDQIFDSIVQWISYP